jgi:hypothetical protein
MINAVIPIAAIPIPMLHTQVAENFSFSLSVISFDSTLSSEIETREKSISLSFHFY